MTKEQSMKIRAQIDKTLYSMRILRTNTENLLEMIDSCEDVEESEADEADTSAAEVRRHVLMFLGELNNTAWSMTNRRGAFLKEEEE